MNKLKLVTHSGKFHADDVFATSALSILFEKTGQEFEIIRSRDQKDIESADIVYDNGVQYDAQNKIFDHHQVGGAGQRENGVPYAAFGLIWKHYGEKVVESYFKNIKNDSVKDHKNDTEPELTTKMINKIAEIIDIELVQPIDAADTGYEDYRSSKNPQLRTYTFGSIVSSFNPIPNEGYEKSFELFMQMVEIAKKILERELIKAKFKAESFERVETAYQNSEDQRIIILDQMVSWKEALIARPEPLFVIFSTIDNDGYIIQAVNKDLIGYAVRRPFPKEWRGKVNEELEKTSGIVGAKFCHLEGFLCVTKTKEQAIKLAQKALE